MLRAITLPCYTNDSGFIVCTNKIISIHYISGQLIASFEILQRIISCNMETEGACNLILFRNIIDLESITLQQPFRKLCRAGVATACQEESSSALSKHRGDKNSSSQKTVLQNAQHICVRGAFMLKCVAHLFSWNPAGVSHRDSSCVSATSVFCWCSPSKAVLLQDGEDILLVRTHRPYVLLTSHILTKGIWFTSFQWLFWVKW